MSRGRGLQCKTKHALVLLNNAPPGFSNLTCIFSVVGHNQLKREVQLVKYSLKFFGPKAYSNVAHSRLEIEKVKECTNVLMKSLCKKKIQNYKTTRSLYYPSVGNKKS